MTPTIVRHCPLLLILLAFFQLVGCSGKEMPRFVWPPPPEEPKFEFIGNFYSEKDFETTKAQKLARSLMGGTPEYAFKTPFGVSGDGKGKIFVSDLHQNNVRVFDFNSQEVLFLTKQPLFQTPAGVAVGPDGTLYVADAAKGMILVFDAKGDPLYTIQDSDHLEKPAFLALNPAGDRLYVSDGEAHRVVVFSTNGTYLNSFGRRGGGEGEFFSPQGLAFGPDGKLFVADMFNARVQVFTPEGEFVRMFGERGDQAWQMENPRGLTFDSEGHLYLVDGRRSTVSVFEPDGRLLLVLGEGRATFGPFGFSAPRGIYIDPSDRIFVAEALGKRFSVWQYLSRDYLAQKPWTEADKARLNAYMKDVQEKNRQ